MKSQPPLVSTELEVPVVSLRDGTPPPPEVFQSLWDSLAGLSWKRQAFGVAREYPLAVPCMNPLQSMVTDSGPTLELVTSPATSISRIALQLDDLQTEARAALEDLGYAMLGCAVHPRLRAVPEEYYRYRTPRASYDYAIEQRRWNHWSIVHIASVQEVVDVELADAVRVMRLLHRLAGLMNFLLRNDPDLDGQYGGALSIRPQAWRDHVPHSGLFAADAERVYIPGREFSSWRDYLSLLWEQGAMFLIGTKDKGLAYVPQHPTFMRFLKETPDGGWPAKTLAGEEIRVVPEFAHVTQTDWTYMGMARIRWKWRDSSIEIGAFLDAWQRDDIEAFLAANLEKVVVENRCNSTQPPGENLASLALVTGLITNLDQALELAMREPYSFWALVLEASMTAPFDSTVADRPILVLAREMVDVAREGLRVRGEVEAERALSSLYARIDDRCSYSERLLRDYRSGGVERLIKRLRI